MLKYGILILQIVLIHTNYIILYTIFEPFRKCLIHPDSDNTS